MPTIIGRPLNANQRAAVERNWNIKRLRGIYAQGSHLITDNARRKAFQHILDTELAVLGAESETSRREDFYKKLSET